MTRIQGRYVYRRRVHFRNLISKPVTLALKTADPRNARRLSTRLSSRFVEVKEQVAQMMEEGRQLNGAEIEALFRHQLEQELRGSVQSYMQLEGHSSSIEGIAEEIAEAAKLLLKPDRTPDLTFEERDDLECREINSDRVAFYMKQLNEAYSVFRAARYLEAIGAPVTPITAAVARAQLLRATLSANKRSLNFSEAVLLDVPDVAAALLTDTGQASDEAKPLIAILNAKFQTIYSTNPWADCDDDDKASGTPHPDENRYLQPEHTGTPLAPTNKAGNDALTVHPVLPCQFVYRDPRLFSEIIEPTLDSLKKDGKWRGDVSQQRRIMQTFAWITGDKALGDYNHLDVTTFKEGLQSLPGNFMFGSLYERGAMARPFADARADLIASGTLTQTKKRKAATLNRDMSTMATVSAHLAKTVWKTVSPSTIILDFKNGRMTETSNGSTLDLRPPWKRAHLQELFASPLYTGNDGHLNRLRCTGRKPEVYHDAAYWAPLFWYYTGACREEICGLELDDVIVDAPVPHIWIRDNKTRGRDGEMAGEKREARNRLLPIPEEILRLGFVAYHKAVRAEGHDSLFPELYVNAEKRGGAFFYDRAWQHMVNYIGARISIPVNADGKRSDIHSIRSLVSSCFEVDGINDNLRADIMGHAREGTNGKHYSKRLETEGLDVVLAERRAMMTKYIPNITSDLSIRPVRLLPMEARSRTGAGITRKTRSDLGLSKAP